MVKAPGYSSGRGSFTTLVAISVLGCGGGNASNLFPISSFPIPSPRLSLQRKSCEMIVRAIGQEGTLMQNVWVFKQQKRDGKQGARNHIHCLNLIP